MQRLITSVLALLALAMLGCVGSGNIPVASTDAPDVNIGGNDDVVVAGDNDGTIIADDNDGVTTITPATARAQIENSEISYNEEGFLDAIKAGDATLVGLFLRAGMNPNAEDEKGSTRCFYRWTWGTRDS